MSIVKPAYKRVIPYRMRGVVSATGYLWCDLEVDLRADEWPVVLNGQANAVAAAGTVDTASVVRMSYVDRLDADSLSNSDLERAVHLETAGSSAGGTVVLVDEWVLPARESERRPSGLLVKVSNVTAGYTPQCRVLVGVVPLEPC